MAGSKGMGDIAQGVEGAGVALSGVAAYNKSKADKTAYDMQATVADNNATMARAQASDAIKRGQTAEVNAQLRTRQLQGTQAAQMAANGLDLSSGSPLSILSDTEFMGANDAAVIHANALKEAYGFNMQEANSTNNAKLLRYRSGMESPGTAAATSLLTGAGTVASRWYSRKHPYNGAEV
jgi:hypothetical protein